MNFPSWLNPKQSFRVRLVLVVLFLGVLFSQVSAYLIRKSFVEQIETDKGLLMAEMAHQMAGEMDRGVFERLREIQIIASLPMLADQKVSFVEKQALLERVQASYRNYAWIGFTDIEGNIIAGTNNLLVGKSVAQRSWFLLGAKGPAVGDVHDAFLLAKMLPKPENDFLPLRLLDISAPIHDENGKLLGVICGHLSWDWSFQVKNALLAPLKEHAKADILIVGKEGQILLGTPELQKLTDKLDLPSLSAARQGKNGFLTEIWPDGQNYLTGYAASSGYDQYKGLGWTILVRQSTDEAFAIAEVLRQRGTITSIAFSLVFAIVLWLISGRLIGPIRRIAVAATRIGNGENGGQIPVIEGEDEVSTLSRSLVDMVHTLENQKAALAASNQQLKLAAQVFSSSSEGIIITDAQERIVSVNAAYTEITGFTSEEIVGQTPRVVSSGKQDKAFYQAMWADIKQHGRWQGEVCNRRKNGDVFTEWLTIIAVCGPTGNVDHYIGVFADITQMRRKEEELREKTTFQTSLLNAIPIPVFYKDREGRYLGFNKAYEIFFGATNDQLIGKTVFDISPQNLAEIYQAKDQELFDSGGIQEYESKVKDRNGGAHDVIFSKAVFTNSRGDVAGLIGTILDITERKNAEEELRSHHALLEKLVAERTQELEKAKEDAEAASRSKSTFLANMSHELRSPMNAIMGMTNIALRRAEDPKLKDQLSKIDNASRHLLAVINDVLDISKIEAERLTLEINTFILSEVLENLTNLLGHDADNKGLQLKTILPPKIACIPLRGDQMRLGQILLNLTANAIKFTEHGSITIRSHLVEENENEVLLRFEVEDTGIGISDEDIGRLFNAFEQADSSMTRKYGGTGLGLAISKRLAKLMGGEIGVESRPNVGSTFWFSLPLGKSSDIAGSSPTQACGTFEAQLLANFAGTRILLAEDEPINQEVSCNLLEEAGLVIDIAEDGQKALELAKQFPYALILMDMQMPILNGVDATLAIRKLSGYAKTPILAMTANAFDEDRQVCIEAGMNDHIGKPVDPGRLFEILFRWLTISCHQRD